MRAWNTLANLSSLTRAVDLDLTVCPSVVLQVMALRRHPLTWVDHRLTPDWVLMPTTVPMYPFFLPSFLPSFLPVFHSQIQTIVREAQSGLGVSHASGSLGEAKSVERWRRMQKRYEEVTQRNVEASGD